MALQAFLCFADVQKAFGLCRREDPFWEGGTPSENMPDAALVVSGLVWRLCPQYSERLHCSLAVLLQTNSILASIRTEQSRPDESMTSTTC